MSIAMESYRSSFRQDLCFRLSVVPIHGPPLRERREDILPLVSCLLNRIPPLNEATENLEKQIILAAWKKHGSTRKMNLYNIGEHHRRKQ